MNNIFYIFMEDYKNKLISFINNSSDKTIEDDPRFTINRNGEGKIHSRYLGDRYEPAIIWKNNDCVNNYYLFDGDVKDCTHPFLISYYNERIQYAYYYSSERIRNGEPIYVTKSCSYYNRYDGKFILDEYESKFVYKVNNLENIVLCEEMVEPFKFKFAD